MRYKEQTIRQVDGQIQKLMSIHRGIETKSITVDDTLKLLKETIRALQLVSERLQLEHDE